MFYIASKTIKSDFQMSIFGVQNFSMMNLLGQYRAIAGVQNANASIMSTNQNQMNFMGHLGGPLKSDTVNFSGLAKMDKQNAMSKATAQTQLKMYEAQLEALKKAEKKKTYA